MRETTKQVKHEVDGVEMTFQIRKMDALHGTYLVKFATEKLVPVFAKLQDIFTPVSNEKELAALTEKRTQQVLQVIPEALAGLQEDELINLEMRCLRTVDVLKPAGWQPVMIGDRFGVEELENDIMTALILTYEVIEFNLGSFFGGKSLSSLLPKLNTLQ